jgi:uncharacterized membrane protein
MKRILKYFVNGLITVVPICTVGYVVIQLFEFLDNILGGWIRKQIGGDYLPGLGLVVTILLVTIIGWLATLWLTKRIFDFADQLLNRIPVVKSLYSIIKETLQSLMGEKRSFSKVALIRWPGTGMRVIGFITSEHLTQFGDGMKDHVSVYIPQSFQIAGITVIVPSEDVEILDMKVEDALKFILSAGVSDTRGNETITEVRHR